MDNDTIKKWIKSGIKYPCFLSTNFIHDFFIKNGFENIGFFFKKYDVGKSKYLIYKKK